MSVATLAERELLVIVDDGATPEEWHAAREAGVTASEIHDIAAGSRKTWRRISDDKLNGSTFHGNKHTRLGHAREPYILAEARILPGVVVLASSRALFGSHENPLHRATPDGFGIHEQLGEFGVEVKNHHEGWDGDGVPADHFDQIQWGMHVTGFSWWLYAWAVEGVDGIRHEWVPRDDKRIGQLVAQADAFLEWHAAGAPEIDDLPDDVDDALAEYARGLALEADGKKLKSAARAVLDGFAAKQAAEPGEPLRKSGSRAALFFEPKPAVRALDPDAWAAADSESHEEWVAAREHAASLEAAALERFWTEKPVAATFRVTANGVSA